MPTAAAATARDDPGGRRRGRHFVADVSDEAAVERGGRRRRPKRFGPATVLFNHAGTIVIKPFLETTLAGMGLAACGQRALDVPDDPGGAAAA